MDDDAGPSALKHEKFEDDVLDGEEGEEPQERLQMNPGDDGGIVWLAKVPKSLMEVWKQVQPNTHLATIRVYDPTPDGKRKISILLPDNPTYDTRMESRELLVNMDNEKVDSHYIVADREKPNQPNKRLRTTKLTGKVHHKVSLRNIMDEHYEAKIRLRSAEANRPKKQISKLYNSKTDLDVGNSTNLKMIQSGAAQNHAGFGNLGKKNKAPVKGEFERAARISRDELLDLLFSLFTADKPFWSMKELRAKTVQPEVYLKEVLTDIGVFHKAGSNVNHWSLKPEYVSGSAAAGMMMDEAEDGAGPSGTKQEAADDDDDDDDDMEQVS